MWKINHLMTWSFNVRPLSELFLGCRLRMRHSESTVASLSYNSQAAMLFTGRLWDWEGRDGWNSQACRTVGQYSPQLYFFIHPEMMKQKQTGGFMEKGAHDPWGSWPALLDLVLNSCPKAVKWGGPWVTSGKKSQFDIRTQLLQWSWSSSLTLCSIDKTWSSILSVWVKGAKERAKQGQPGVFRLAQQGSV